MLTSCVKHTNLKLEDISEQLGVSVAKLIQGTAEMDAIHNLHTASAHHSHEHANIDNLRKMLLAMVDDVRVVLIKLAEQLCVLRNMTLVSDAEKRDEARETIAYFLPLINANGVLRVISRSVQVPYSDKVFPLVVPEVKSAPVGSPVAIKIPPN